jgi:hypothetical protein
MQVWAKMGPVERTAGGGQTVAQAAEPGTLGRQPTCIFSEILNRPELLLGGVNSHEPHKCAAVLKTAMLVSYSPCLCCKVPPAEPAISNFYRHWADGGLNTGTDAEVQNKSATPLVKSRGIK